MKLYFSVCDLCVFGYYLQRTLEPIDGKVAPIRNIIYGTGSKFVLVTGGVWTAVLRDDNANEFLISTEKLDTLFEIIE